MFFSFRKYKKMAPVIGAAGALLGGLAGQAVMGKPASVGPDTSVPGITKATIQKGTKSNPGISVAQVDPSQALGYFKQAASQYSQQALTGINLYQGSIQNAINSVNQNTDKSNLQLGQIAAEGTPAAKEYMRMLGLNPPSSLSTSGFFDQVKGDGYGGIAQQMQDAENIADPKQRELAKQNIMSQLNTQGGTLSDSERQAAMQSGMLNTQSNSVMNVEDWIKSNKMDGALDNNKFLQYQKNLANGTAQRSGDGGRIPLDVLSPQGQAAYNQYLQSVKDGYKGQQMTDGQQSIADALAAKQQQAKDLVSQFASGYSGTLDKGYSGTEINKKLEATPGYQFSLQQGLQGISRSAAAAGLLTSGNTAAAASQYSQGLAQNTYQGFLNNLSPLMTQGNSAISQMANNYMSQGGSLAQLYGNLGSGLLSAYQNIGQAYNNAYTNAGQTAFSASLANMQAQNQAISQKHSQDFQASQNANTNAINSGYLNLANQQFNYQVGQNQNYGAGFSYGGGGGNSQGAGTGWPSFNSNSAAWYI